MITRAIPFKGIFISVDRHFEIWFPKKENSYITTQKRHNFACDNYSTPKTRASQNKQWTHLGALKQYV